MLLKILQNQEQFLLVLGLLLLLHPNSNNSKLDSSVDPGIPISREI